MKRCLLVLLVLLMALSAVRAWAEDLLSVCWTTKEDPCYHLDEHCGDGDLERFPLSLEAAEEFDKQPCPICAAENRSEDMLPVLATERGGTWVIRVPQAALEAASLHAPAEEVRQDSIPVLCARMRPDTAEQRLAVPTGDALFMNLRAIDGDCCLVVRPGRPYSENNPFAWEVRSIQNDFFGENATLTGVSDELRSVPEVKKDDYTMVFSRTFDKGDIDVYRAIGVNVAVIHWKGDRPGEVALVKVGDREAAGLPVAGYASGDAFVYCCVISDAELGALVAGGEPVTFAAAEVQAESR